MTRPPRPHRLVLAAASISTGLGVAAVFLALANEAGLATAVITGGTTTGGAMALAMQILDYLRRPWAADVPGGRTSVIKVMSRRQRRPDLRVSALPTETREATAAVATEPEGAADLGSMDRDPQGGVGVQRDQRNLPGPSGSPTRPR